MGCLPRLESSKPSRQAALRYTLSGTNVVHPIQSSDPPSSSLEQKNAMGIVSKTVEVPVVRQQTTGVNIVQPTSNQHVDNSKQNGGVLQSLIGMFQGKKPGEAGHHNADASGRQRKPSIADSETGEITTSLVKFKFGQVNSSYKDYSDTDLTEDQQLYAKQLKVDLTKKQHQSTQKLFKRIHQHHVTPAS